MSDQGEIEAVARIIDPDAWAYFDHDAGQHSTTDLLRFSAWKQSSIRKAKAAIQALNAYRTATGVGDGGADETLERGARALTEHAYGSRGLALSEESWGVLRASCMDGLRAALNAMETGE